MSETGKGRRPNPDGPGPDRRGRVKLRDVAAAAGVHYSTVSRVLRSDPGVRVSPTVAARIRATAAELGYSPDIFAAGMHSKSLKSVGVIVHDITDPVYPPIVRGIEAVLRGRGFMTVIGNAGYDAGVETDMYEQMSERMVDGLIVGTTRLDDPTVERAVAAGVPIVSFLRRTRDDLCSAAVNDCAAGMRGLVDLAVGRGFRDFAVVAAPQTLSTARDRLDGIREGLAAHGIDLPPDRLAQVPRMNRVEGARAVRRLLDARATPPEVVICVNDLVALGAYDVAAERGMDCPGDISITGFNDMPMADMISPPLTTVRMELEAIGRQSAELLFEQLDERGPPRIVRLAPELKQRGSLGWPRRRA